MEIEKNYTSAGVPELETGTLVANISSVQFQNDMRASDQERDYRSVMFMRAVITAPEKFKGEPLQIDLASSESPDDIIIAERNVRGVALLTGVFVEHLALQAAYSNDEYRNLQEFLLAAFTNKQLPVTVEAKVLGLGRQCEWKMEDGVLLVSELSFITGVLNA